MISAAMLDFNLDFIRNKVAKLGYRIGGESFVVNLENKSKKPMRLDFAAKIKASHRPGELCDRVSLLDADEVELFYRDVSIERNADYGDIFYIYTLRFENLEE